MSKDIFLCLLSTAKKISEPYIVVKLCPTSTFGQLISHLQLNYNTPLAVETILGYCPALDIEIIKNLSTERLYSPLIVFSLKPPKYSKKTKLKCQGYWSGKYQPKKSKHIWPGKQTWVDMSQVVEQRLQTEVGHWRNYRGLAPSRLQTGGFVGSGQFFDLDAEGRKICWPEGYISHYILHHNVMPTKIMFRYIVWRYGQIVDGSFNCQQLESRTSNSFEPIIASED